MLQDRYSSTFHYHPFQVTRIVRLRLLIPKTPLHTMTASVAANTTLNFALRAAQLILAIIVTGTDGYGTAFGLAHSIEASLRLISSSSYPLVP